METPQGLQDAAIDAPEASNRIQAQTANERALQATPPPGSFGASASDDANRVAGLPLEGQSMTGPAPSYIAPVRHAQDGEIPSFLSREEILRRRYGASDEAPPVTPAAKIAAVIPAPAPVGWIRDSNGDLLVHGEIRRIERKSANGSYRVQFVLSDASIKPHSTHPTEEDAAAHMDMIAQSISDLIYVYPEDEPANDEPEHGSLEAMTQSELYVRSKELGLNLHHFSGKDKLIAAIRDAEEEQALQDTNTDKE